MSIHHPIVKVSDIDKTEEKCITVYIDTMFELPLSEVRVLTPIQGEMSFEINQNLLICSGNFKSELELTCDRCLEKYHYPLNQDIREIMEIVKKKAMDKELEMAYDEAFEQVTRHELIDVLELLGQYIILELPVKKLCSENCYNIELKKLNQESIDKQTDPRWASLHEIVKTWEIDKEAGDPTRLPEN